MIEQTLELLQQRKVEQAKIDRLIEAGAQVGTALEDYVAKIDAAAVEVRRSVARLVRLIASEVVAGSKEQKIADMYARLRRLAAEAGAAEIVPWAALNGVIAAQFGDEGLERVQENAYQQIKAKPAEVRPASIPERHVQQAAKRPGVVAAVSRGRPRYAQGTRRG